MKISVVVPTFRRPESLQYCLSGLRAQARPADEVLIVIQESDHESLNLLEQWSVWAPLTVIRCPVRGMVSQLNFGLEMSHGEIIALTDDDAVPRADWLFRIESHFLMNPDLGGVGGRDFVQENGIALTGAAHLVGAVQWFGRVVGNHHIGTRLLPCVDILKGVNMAFRAAAIGRVRFDRDLRGQGAQTCCDMAFSLAVQKRGWRLLFDPEVAVDHYPAQRFDADQRSGPSIQAIEDNSFNFYLALRRHMRRGWHRRAALCWAWLIGVERTPGLIRGWLPDPRGKSNGSGMRSLAVRAWRSAKQVCAVES